MPARFKTINVRSAQPADEPFFSSLDARLSEENPNSGGNRHSLSPGTEVQSIIVDGENAGRLIIERASGGLVITDISLLPEWRNSGIGTAALRRVFGEAAATQKPVCATVPTGGGASRFFERLGFVKIAEGNFGAKMEWRALAPIPKAQVLSDSLKLPLSFDPKRLQADLASVLSGEFVRHFNTNYFEGDWSGVPFRSVGGSARSIYPDPTAKDKFADTPLVERCAYVREVLAALPCPQHAVRFLRLKAGSVIKEHRDYDLGFEDGEVRLHIPVVTNPDVEFVLNQVRVIMNEGECWYLDVNLPHRVANRGATDRIHLVVDCVVNDWLRDLLLTTEASLRATA